MGKNPIYNQVKIDLSHIRQLVRDWNPLDIPDLPDDEYSWLEFRIYRKLLDGVSGDELTACMTKWKVGNAGLEITPVDQARIRHHAELIMSWWKLRQEAHS